MKKAKKNSPKKLFEIEVRINKELDKYEKVILFPEKLAECNEMLKTTKLPK